MKNIILLNSLLLLLTTVMLSCNVEEEIEQGVIEYEISYPVKNYDQSLKMFLPKTMIMTYRNNIYKNEVSNKLFSSTMIANCNKKQMTMILNYDKKQIYTTLNHKETIEMINSFPTPEFVTSINKESILGIICTKHYGIFEKLEDGHDVELFETDKIHIKNSNWCNQYNKVKGVLLGYEVEKFGLNMKFMAKSINTQTSISDDAFSIPENYKKVSLDKFLREMEDIFSIILN